MNAPQGIELARNSQRSDQLNPQHKADMSVASMSAFGGKAGI